MLRRIVKPLPLLVVVLAFLAAACGGSDSESSTTTATGSEGGGTETTAATGGDRKISVLTFNSPEQLEPLIAAWSAVNPDVEVEVQAVPFGDLNPVIQSRVGSGDPSVDVYLVDQPRLASLASRDLLLDLTDRVAIPDGVLLDDAVEWSSFDGKLYALPVHTSTQLLFYNPDLLEGAGVDVPSTDPAERWTWEQIAEAGATVQESAGVQWGLLFEQGASPYQVLPLAESLGGGPGLGGDDMLTPALTTPGWIAAMEWWHGVHEDEIMPRGMGFGVTTETFAAGQAPFFLAGPWNIGILDSQELAFEYGVAPHPYFADGDVVTPTGSFSWGVNPAAQNVDDAVAFVEFVSINPAGSAAITEGDPNIPTNIEVLGDYLSQEAFQRGNGGTIGDLIRYEVENTARLRPVSVGYIQYETVVGAALEDIRNGLDVASTLSNAEAELQSALAGLGS